MKALFKSIALASLGLAVLLSCTKNEVDGLEREDGKMTLSVTGVLGEYKAAEGTKASLVNTPRVGWNGNEAVHVFQQSDGTYLGSLTSTVTAPGASVATLGGTISSGTGTLVFVYTNATVPSLTEGSTYTSLEISLAEQGADIPFVVYGTADSPGTETVSGLVVNFSFATSVVSTYAAGLPAGKEVTQAALDSINTACSLSITGGGTPSGSEPGTITKTAGIGNTNDDGQVLFGIAVPASDAASSRSVVFTIDSEPYTTAFSGAAIAAGNAYSAMAENNAVEYVAFDTPADTVTKGSSKILTITVYPAKAINALTWESSDPTIATVDENGKVTGVKVGTATITATSQEDPSINATCTVTVSVPVPAGFVDLGLPSGIFWAEKNLGASSATDYGEYYMWGETTGHASGSFAFGKDSKGFVWDNAPFNGGKTSFDEDEFNNVRATACPGGVLALEYDAASNANNSWRMPTTEDFKELFQQCYAEWGTYNSVNGLIVYKAKSADDKGYAYFNSKMNQYSGSGNTWDTTPKTRPSYSTASDTFLFFPAAGFGSYTSLNSAGSYGYYWSSSLYTVRYRLRVLLELLQ